MGQDHHRLRFWLGPDQEQLHYPTANSTRTHPAQRHCTCTFPLSPRNTKTAGFKKRTPCRTHSFSPCLDLKYKIRLNLTSFLLDANAPDFAIQNLLLLPLRHSMRCCISTTASHGQVGSDKGASMMKVCFGVRNSTCCAHCFGIPAACFERGDTPRKWKSVTTHPNIRI